MKSSPGPTSGQGGYRPEPLPSSARARLGELLKELLDASGGPIAEVVRKAETTLGTDTAGSVPTAKQLADAFRRWRRGAAAPLDTPEWTDGFWALVRAMREMAGQRGPDEDSLAVALRAARAERDGTRGRRGEGRWLRARDVLPHVAEESSASAHWADARRSLLAALRTQPPGYTYVHGGLGAGKTAFFVSLVREGLLGSNVVAHFATYPDEPGRFLREAGAQLQALAHVGHEAPAPPRTAEEYSRELFRALQDTQRELVLLIDGIDAFPTATSSLSPLDILPPSLPDSLRVILSGRRLPLPAALPMDHPLRDPRCWWRLPSYEGYGDDAPAREALRAIDRHPAARTVAETLAAARTALTVGDLTELSGLPAEEVRAVLHDPASRFFMLDDRLPYAYVLAHPALAGLLRSPQAADRFRARRTAWETRSVTEGWTPQSPAYLLERSHLACDAEGPRPRTVLDARRQAALVVSRGVTPALEQMEELRIAPQDVAHTGLRAAARALILCHRLDVPLDLLRTLGTLGEADLGRALARAAPTEAQRALRFAVLGSGMACAGFPEAAATAAEAVRCASRARADVSWRLAGQEEAEELAAASWDLLRSGLRNAGHRLLLATLLDQGTGTAAQSAKVLDENGLAGAELLDEYARDLSCKGPVERLMAVELWAVMTQQSQEKRRRKDAEGREQAQRKQAKKQGQAEDDCEKPEKKYTAPCFRQRIIRLCDEQWADQHVCGDRMLETADLHSLAVRALCASGRPLRKKAGCFAGRAEELLRKALRGAGGEASAGRARLPYEMSVSLARYLQALEALYPENGGVREAEALLALVPDEVREVVVGLDFTDLPRRVAEQVRKDAQARRERSARRDAERVQKGTGADRDASASRSAAVRRAAVQHPLPLGHREEDTASRGQDARPVYQQVRTEWAAGLDVHARELLNRALPVAAGADAERLRFVFARLPGLAAALARTGDADRIDALADALPDPAVRLRLFAGAAVGWAGAYEHARAAQYAERAAACEGEAVDLVGRLRLAQAFAYAGTAEEAERRAARARGGLPLAERRPARRATVLVTIGLSGTHPDRAAWLAEEHAMGAATAQRLAGAAEWLLALPDPRAPGPRLSAALREAAASPSLTDDPEDVVVHALLEMLVPDVVPARIGTGLETWAKGVDDRYVPWAGLAVTAALKGDVDAILAAADGARPTARAEALAAAAALLCGAPIPLPAEPEGPGRLLAIAKGLGAVARPADARELLRRLLGQGDEGHALPLLPHVLPETAPALADLHLAHLPPLLR
ncbi:hypothetical protein [Streptomyces sp. NPDC047046]|uniref:hypothetical protein n=1 Tax=Streptomyces sp. NPDC047046 TaxID=3155378 RepID=UPI00340F8CBE